LGLDDQQQYLDDDDDFYLAIDNNLDVESFDVAMEAVIVQPRRGGGGRSSRAAHHAVHTYNVCQAAAPPSSCTVYV
jgi:hypothetical protein